MRALPYLPYEKSRSVPNIIVDGAGNESTLLTLSHWPHSGTPESLQDDLSIEIAFRYLESPACFVEAQVVSNNHFDEEGLVSLFVLTSPEEALAQREFLVEVASAGDFGVCKNRAAARVAFTIAAWADPETSPLDRAWFHEPKATKTGLLYQALLPRVPELLADVQQFAEYWQVEDQRFAEAEELVKNGSITFEEIPDLDVAIVRLPDAGNPVGSLAQDGRGVCHHMAIHNATDRFCLIRMQGQTYELQYRYETWIQYISRRPRPRVDLAPLAAQLTEQEKGSARWSFDAVDGITPRLYLVDAPESSLAPEIFLDEVKSFLSEAPPAWNPYPMP